ncbi:uncharacterized protein BHQ10_003656 [Talaromyces amestolkiae]|uniref:Uncharacterized protein n=1 Tax=Talaromyces amestolkiae TaxID=1196081 RepID=A0A364KVS8_TALAM|nr:uncharacterized protein BHQ10_003656 [Talaromyces amestolkiae]RAO67644.1 hypothetical protein BHQ10_003656 [Talaromyces amestolkiae]
MNTWRNKGYVPDSDDDEDFESQESRKEYSEEQAPTLDDDDRDGVQLTGLGEDKNSIENGEGVKEYEQYSESAELGSDHSSYNDDEDEGAREKDQELQSVELNLNDGGHNNNAHDGDHEGSHHLLSVDLELNNESDTLIPPETDPLLAKSGSAIEPLLTDDEAASSDDELHFIGVVPNKSETIYTTNSADIPNDVLGFQSDSDSPLSSAPSVIVSPDSSQQAHQIHGDQHSQPQRLVAPQIVDLVDEDALSQTLTSDILALDTELQPQRRSLRERKEIQMHPYLIEDAKYQSLVRKAGLKPVRVVTAESAARHTQGESQESIIGAPEPPSSPPSEFIFPPSSPPDPCKSPASISRQRIPKDKSQLVHDHVQPHSQKRRKLFHDSQVKKHKQQFPSCKVVIDKADTFVSPNTTQSIQAPLSPPRSGSVPSAAHVGKDGFRFPRGFTPPAKTFDTTVQSVSMDATDLTIDDDFDSVAPLDAEDDHITSQTSVEDNEPEESASEMAVKQYQRRIKGVLPASWLTLDLKNKGGKTANPSSDKHQRELLSTRAEPQKGVARPISRPRSIALESLTPRATFAFLEDSSDSDDADLDAPAAVDIQVAKESRKTSADLRKFYDPTNDMDEDIPEDNTLEEIFSPVRRSLFSHNRSHSSIPKTYKRKQVSYRNNQPQKSRPLRQVRLDDRTPRPSKRKVRRPQIPNLSILDAPDVARRSRKEQPQFLRVATRQARSRKDQGRSSPSRKVFNMATREETKETNKALWDWKKGSMKQAKLSMTSTPRSARQPLQSLSANRQERTDRNHTSTLPQNSVSDERPRFLRELDLTSENLTFAQPLAVPPVKSRVISTTMKQSRLVRKNVISRTHAITSLRRNGARPVESEIVGGEAGLSPYAFSASLAALDKDRKRTFTLDRYISTLEPPDQDPSQFPRPAIQPIPERIENQQPARHKPPRKRIPARAEVIDIDPMPQITASSEPAKRTHTTPVDNTKRLSNTLYGFGNFRVFSVDFNVLPIRKGTYFHDSTFIGECGLSRSLNINKRNMDQDVGFAVIDLGDQVFRWGPWTEQVSSELGVIMDLIKNEIEKYGSLPEISSNSDTFRVFVFVIRWITDTMHFIDPIDRVSFIERVVPFICDLHNHVATACHANHSGWQGYLRLASLNMIFANQIRQVASHELVNPSKREDTLNLVKTVSRQISSLMYTHHGLQNIRQFNERNQDVNLESGIRHGFPAVEAHIILFQILHSSQEFQGWFNELALLSFADKASSSNIQHLEEVWEAVFTTLPLYEIDEFGLGRPGLRFRDKYDQWPIVQTLVSKVLDTYYLDSDQPTFYINYCRVLFQRCLLLMVSWSWRHCKGILETLFDFYAKNMMYNLKTEQSFGSPSFLEALDTNPTIEIEPCDSSFHLFLKILGSGLRYLSQVHDKKTMRNITWRLLPNHGRVYPKEKPLAHEDLDALRNHHDLLCTLYWAVPGICRPRLQTIRNVIDPATSHLETMSLSIRSWRRLVHFKLSTNEEDADLKHFADWYKFFASGIVRQHQLAKTEVEAQAKNQMHFSKQDVESTVSHNQRQIEALISSTITAMDSAIQSSRSFGQACLLVEGFPIVKLFELFDPVNSRANHIICDGLQLVIKFLAKDLPLVNSTNSPTNDDSQEYGDWSALEEVFDGVAEPAAAATTFPYLQEVIRPCVSRLLSNCFGEDRPPEDSLLLKLTECWSALAHASVRSGLEHWDSYLNPYSGNSWTALRMTPQTKKFGPQFLANCIENDSQFFSECRLQILTMWVSCLVERTSALKFQHRLTEVLLNEDQTLLMKNLPFNRGTDGRYHVSLSELTDRRISLISSLLSNMREHLQTQDNTGSVNTKAIDEYRELIMAMMATMKTNYQELGQSGKTARGQYVEFVHDIISFMQQHTQSICPIDRYFTDPSTFPLPLGDPGLVVAKLKGYGIRLPATKAAKELVNFLQGICESAALDDRQGELVAQLCESMGETYESGDTANPTLRSFLLHCLFPAYIECALSSTAAWIFVLPVMKATSRAARDLLYDVDINDPDCIKSVNSMFGAILRAIRQVIYIFIQDADYTEKTRALLIIKSCIDIISAMVPILDYFVRNGHSDDHNMAILGQLRTYTAFIVQRLFEPSTVMEDQYDIFPDELTDNTHVNPLFLEHRTYTTRQVQTYLRTNWSKHNGRYFVRRGREPRVVETEITKSKEIVDVHYAKSSLVEAANMYLHRWESFNQPDEQSRSDAFGESKVYDALGEGFNDLLL